MSVLVDSIVTTDAAPTAAPHRISRQASKDVALVTLHLDDIVHLYPSGGLEPDTAQYPAVELYPSPVTAGLHPMAAGPQPGATIQPGAAQDPQDGPIPESYAIVRGYRLMVGGASAFTGTYVGGRGLPCGTDTLCGPDSYADDFTARSFDALTEDVTGAELAASSDGAVTVTVYGHVGGWV